MPTKIRLNKTCEFCKNEFIAKTTKTRYCSHTCNRHYYKQLKREEHIQTAIEKESTKNVDTSIYEAITAKDYLSIKESAVLLGISERTFYRLMKDGTIKSHKLGRRTVIQRSDINSLFS